MKRSFFTKIGKIDVYTYKFVVGYLLSVLSILRIGIIFVSVKRADYETGVG
jgi:hypothetical protein